jgi:hypothetical protein
MYTGPGVGVASSAGVTESSDAADAWPVAMSSAGDAARRIKHAVLIVATSSVEHWP